MPQKVIAILTFPVSETYSNIGHNTTWLGSLLCRKLSIQGSESGHTWKQTVTHLGTLHGANQHKTIYDYVEYESWEILGFLLPDSFVCIQTLPELPINTRTQVLDKSSILGKALVINSTQLAGNMFHGQALLHATLFCHDTHECTYKSYPQLVKNMTLANSIST
jgi:hypothetical protein